MLTIVTVIQAAINPFRRRYSCLCGYKTHSTNHFKSHISTHQGELIEISPEPVAA